MGVGHHAGKVNPLAWPTIRCLDGVPKEMNPSQLSFFKIKKFSDYLEHGASSPTLMI